MSVVCALNDVAEDVVSCIAEHVSEILWEDKESGYYAFKCRVSATSHWTDCGLEYDSELTLIDCTKMSALDFGFQEKE